MKREGRKEKLRKEKQISEIRRRERKRKIKTERKRERKRERM